jgi:phosphatidylinositol glycan class B
MKLVRSPYFKWFLLGFGIQIITAWFSVGYHAPDEHFQILEFGYFKMAHTPAGDLPWEYAARIRPALQPLIVYVISKPFSFLGLFDPFLIAFLLRLMTGVFTCWICCRLILLLLPEFITERGKRIFVCCSMLLWFVPYLEVRFSAENVSGSLLLLSILLLFELKTYSSGKRTAALLTAGLLLGCSAFLRVQMSFAILGMGLWLLFVYKLPWRDWALLISFGIIALGINVCIDHWFYEAWVFTPLNYFDVNIIQHKAAEFGVFPWWYYFKMFLESAVPPISIVLLFFFLSALYKKRAHLFGLICICFLLPHFLTGHKEIRFLFPIVFPFIFLCCIGIDKWLAKNPDKRYYRWLFPVMVVMNCSLLLYRAFAPAQESMSYYKFIYRYSQQQSTTLITQEKSPYKLVGIPVNFYKPPRLDLAVVQDSAALMNTIRSGRSASVLFLSYDLAPHITIPGYRLKRIYCLLPDWILQFNVNNWESRSHIWSIYEVTADKITRIRAWKTGNHATG